MKTWIAILVVAVAAAAAGYGVYQWRHGPSARVPADALWSQALRDTAGASRTLSEWRGKVLVVNFWATWCAPCREEIPMFVKLQKAHQSAGLQFVGIAIDEPGKVEAFAREFGINYPLLIGALDAAEWSRRLGNTTGALPYTLVVDRQGEVRMAHLGAIKEAELLPYIRTLL